MTRRDLVRVPLFLVLFGVLGLGSALADDVFSYDKNVVLIERALSRGDCGQAIQAAERLVNNAPKDVEALTYMFRAWQCGGECNQAKRLVSSANKMLRLDANNLLGHRYRLKAQLCDGNCVDIVRSYEDFVERGGDGTEFEEDYRSCRGEVVDLVLPSSCHRDISVALTGKPSRSLRWGETTETSTKSRLRYTFGAAKLTQKLEPGDEPFRVVPPGGFSLRTMSGASDYGNFTLAYSVEGGKHASRSWGSKSDSVAVLLVLPEPREIQLEVRNPRLGKAAGKITLASCQVRRGLLYPDRFPSVAARADWQALTKKAKGPKALAAFGFLSGTALTVVGVLQRNQAAGFAEEAAAAQTFATYEEKTAAGDAANIRFASFTGGGIGLLTAGIVGAVVAGIQSKKVKAAETRLNVMLKESVALDEVVEWKE